MTKTVDLHIHTTASDGSCSPAEVVRMAHELGLSAVAITDHDTVSGCAEAAAAGQELGLEAVAGVELTSRYGKTIHILGYFVRTNSPALTRTLDGIAAERKARGRKMAAMMAADGIPIDYDELCRRFGPSPDLPQFGEALVELGKAESVQDACGRYLEKGQPYHLPRRTISIQRSVEVIREAGGVPVLAHPFQYKKNDEELRELIEHCMDHGLKGMECRYSGYGPEKVAYLEALAAEYGLVKTGGSDFHGDNKPHIQLGTGIANELDVPYAWLEKLKKAAGK